MKDKFKYPLWVKSINNNYIVEFTGRNTGTVVEVDPTRILWELGDTCSDWTAHTDIDVWTPTNNPNLPKIKFII